MSVTTQKSINNAGAIIAICAAAASSHANDLTAQAPSALEIIAEHSATLAAAAPAPITDPLSAPAIAPPRLTADQLRLAALDTPSMSILDTSERSTASESARATEGVASGTNYRGETVAGADTRYVEDFESETLGPEWGTGVVRTEHPTLGKHADFTDADQPMLLNVKTDEGRVYDVRMDIYLIPPAGSDRTVGDDQEPAENIFSITVDGRPFMQLSPEDLRRIAGQRPEPGQPFVRKVRFNITAVHGVAEIILAATTPPEASTWGVDNIVIDLGQQDPVMGVIGAESAPSDSAQGFIDPDQGLIGEIPPIPRSRYGDNDFSPDTDGGGVSDPSQRTTDEPPIPAPSTTVATLLAAAALAKRSRPTP